MPINKNEITKEMVEKALQCKTADELVALAKAEGFELTGEEAAAYLAYISPEQAERKNRNSDVMTGRKRSGG